MTASLFEASVRVGATEVPLIEHLMNGQGALSVTLTDCEGEPIWEPGVGETPLWGDVVVTGLFPADTPGSALARVLSLAPAVGDPKAVSIRPVEDRSWERAWMDRFEAMRFGERLWIVPTGTTCPDPGAIELRLDPGLAFGTGTHPTTRLCLEWIDAAELEGRIVVDFGCGSGVLGVAAALKDADRVTCLDIDPQAIHATRENARRNGVSDRLVARQVREGPPGRADVVLANILAGTLIDLADDLQSIVAPGGVLVLAGILSHQADRVEAAFRERFTRFERATIDDWVRLSGTG